MASKAAPRSAADRLGASSGVVPVSNHDECCVALPSMLAIPPDGIERSGLLPALVGAAAAGDASLRVPWTASRRSVGRASGTLDWSASERTSCAPCTPWHAFDMICNAVACTLFLPAVWDYASEAEEPDSSPGPCPGRSVNVARFQRVTAAGSSTA